MADFCALAPSGHRIPAVISCCRVLTRAAATAGDVALVCTLVRGDAGVCSATTSPTNIVAAARGRGKTVGITGAGGAVAGPPGGVRLGGRQLVARGWDAVASACCQQTEDREVALIPRGGGEKASAMHEVGPVICGNKPRKTEAMGPC